MASRQRRQSYNQNLCTISIKNVQVNTRTSDKQGLYLPVTVKEVHCTGTISGNKTYCQEPDSSCKKMPRRIDVYKVKEVKAKPGNYIFVDREQIVINVGCSCHKVYDN